MCVFQSVRGNAAAAVRAAVRASLLIVPLVIGSIAHAQVPPSAEERARYTLLHGVTASNAVSEIRQLIINGVDKNARDGNGRTPLHVAAHLGFADAARALIQGGADANLLDNQRYDIVTIAAVRDDAAFLRAVLPLGASAKNITSIYDGTALIAAAHLGHAASVRELIKAGAPLDHVNNLGWTAVIESIVLGDGGQRHRDTLKALIGAKADLNLPDRNGQSPLALARSRGYRVMTEMLASAGAR